MSSLVFYISGHGFGHASRDIEVINAVRARRPDLPIVVRTSAARWLFDLTVRGSVTVEAAQCDTGIVQRGSLELDAEESVRQARAFMQSLPDRVAAEAHALAAHDAGLVVADIPALGIAAGCAAGVTAVALGNFSWDWVYAAYDGAGDVVEAVGDAYASAEVALRLPMSGGFERFPRVDDVPFIARTSQRDPADTRAAMGVPLDARVVLASFGGHGVTAGMDLDAIDQLDGYLTLVSDNVPFGSHDGVRAPATGGRLRVFDESALYARGFRYEDLVRAADVVVTKPGYGIIAECLANETALLYTSRGHFIEYDVLVREMPRFLRCRFIEQADLYAGRWGQHLDAVLSQPPPPLRPAANGAEVVAERLLSMM